MAINRKGGGNTTSTEQFAWHAAFLSGDSDNPITGTDLGLDIDLSGFQEILSALWAYLEGTFMGADYALRALPEDINSVSRLLPNDAAQAYMDAIDDKGQQITVQYQNGEEVTLSLQEYVEDKATGFKGAIYTDPNGHSIVFYAGMDEMKQSIAAGQQDIAVIAQANAGGAGEQFGNARALFERALETSSSVEVVAYSMGTMYGNRLAAEGVKVTNISDIGLPDLKNTNGQSYFTAEHHDNIRANVTALNIEGDPFVGFVGPVYGRQVVLSPAPDSTGQVPSAARSAFSFLQPEAHLPTAYNRALQNSPAINLASEAPAPSDLVLADSRSP